MYSGGNFGAEPSFGITSTSRTTTSLELRRRIRQDSDSDRQQQLNSRSEVVDGSTSFLNKSNHSIHTQQSSKSSYYEERNNYSHGEMNTLAQSSLGSSSARDRTNEFMTTIRSLQGQQLGRNGNFNQQEAPQDRHGQLARRSREFMTIARSIGKDIANTYTKLEKLTLLAKRKTIAFDDRPAEIQNLTFIIKEDMNQLNRQIGQLRQIAKAQQADLTTGKGRQHQATHSTSVVVALQSRLASMTSDFKQVLEVRTENLKESRSRQQQFSQTAVTTSLPQSAVNGFHSGSVLAATANAIEDDAKVSAGDTIISMDGIQPDQRQLMLHGQSDAYLQDRANTMQSIESTIVELGGIFQQLAHMIKEQEEVMLRIDTNVEETQAHVELGHTELLKYFQSVTSNRWLMVKIFGVLIFFFIFFVIFMA